MIHTKLVIHIHKFDRTRIGLSRWERDVLRDAPQSRTGEALSLYSLPGGQRLTEHEPVYPPEKLSLIMSDPEAVAGSSSISPGDRPTASSAPHFPLEDHELSAASVDDVVAACEKAPYVTTEGKTIKRISENAIVKISEFICQSEARNMHFVAANTSIRVPRVIRSFAVPIDEESKMTYIIMEYIRGTVLADCWNDMSEPRRQKVCDQVVNAITELQSLEVEHPGPIGGGRSKGTWFTIYGAGPFHSVRDLEDWFSHKLDVCKRFNKVFADQPPFTGKFGRLVMSHMDISPRNIILEDADKVCLVDWERAGAYPVHFERAALMLQTQFLDFSERIAASLNPCEKEIKDLFSLMYALTTGALM